jgi:cytochrome subunit of sulfide dehydrogenase
MRPAGTGSPHPCGLSSSPISGVALLVLLTSLFASSGAAAAEATSGRDIAANCAPCHGTNGRSRGIIAPLAGKDRAAIVAEVKAFRDGTRPSTVMQQLAKGYTDAQVEAAAAYLSAQKPAR